MSQLDSSTEATSVFTPANRMSAIGVSKIMQISKLASELMRQGRDIVNLGMGEPDFDTPEHIKTAAEQAMRGGATKYTALDGVPELKAAIQEKFRRDNALDYCVDEIIVSAGAKQVIFNAIMATVAGGEEVIIPAPYWTSYLDIVSITGAKPIVIPCSADEGFLLTAAALEAAITERTRWIILNSPCNPTGATYSRENFQSLLEVMERNPHVWILADDIYEHIVFDNFEFVSPAMVDPRVKDRTLIVNGVSKAYAMTGWRIGYGCGPEPLIKAMLGVQSQTTSCPCSVSQAAAIAALNGPQDVVHERCGKFEIRRNLVVDQLNDIDGISCALPIGAFYVFASCNGLIGRKTDDRKVIASDIDFAEFLLEIANVVVVPGTAFGMSPFFRLSYAASNRELEDACHRIKHACATLR